MCGNILWFSVSAVAFYNYDLPIMALVAVGIVAFSLLGIISEIKANKTKYIDSQINEYRLEYTPLRFYDSSTSFIYTEIKTNSKSPKIQRAEIKKDTVVEIVPTEDAYLIMTEEDNQEKEWYIPKIFEKETLFEILNYVE